MNAVPDRQPARIAPLRAGTPARAPDARVAVWLLACAAMVFAMVVVGGVTRLTHSGLSIVEWQPIVGTIPPLTDAQWVETFSKYQLTPEFRLVNSGMSLAEFKGIFWWEYAHRLLGRLIGAVVFVPLAWFWFTRRIDRPLAIRLSAIFVLGALQGAMGWYMVQSGLVDDPRVSQYRLTGHLLIALAIYAALLWTALGLLARNREAGRYGMPGIRRLAWSVVGVSVLQFLTGGFVAGIRAGLAYNSFPLMNGYLIPPEILSLDPWYLNFASNMATVQFDHRLGAWLLIVLVPCLWLAGIRAPLPAPSRRALHVLLAVFALQIALGIGTLVMRVPVPLAALHQAGALLLFSAALVAAWQLQRA